MFTIFFQRALTVILFGLALVIFPFLSYASHSWDGYHWARTANPFTLKLGSNLTTLEWQDLLGETSLYWWNNPQIFATTSPLVTVIRNGAVPINNADSVGSTDSPQIAMDAYGNAIAVWRQFDGSQYSIWANRYIVGQGAGQGWGSATLVETNNTGHADSPQITMDANGNAIVMWIQHDGTRSNVWANSYTVGHGWDTATQIETDDDGISNAHLAMDANGTAIAVWVQRDGVSSNMWASHYTLHHGWSTPALLESNTGSVNYHQVAMGANGDAIAVWAQSDGIHGGIWSKRYTTGHGWGTATLIEANSSGNYYYPQIDMSPNGDAIAVWRHYTNNSIWVSRYTVGHWGAATLLAENAGLGSEQIAMDANGNVIAVWTQFDGIIYNLWANRFTVDQGWGVATLIETNDKGDVRYPRITMDAHGNAMVVWEHNNSIFKDHFDHITVNALVNRYTVGRGWGSAVPFEGETVLSVGQSQIAMNDHGQAMAVWATDWVNKIWAINLATIAPASTDCRMVAGTTQVCNGHYGRNGWLALTTLDIADGNHITQASMRLNDSYFDTTFYNNPNEKLHVMCQGVAHTFGLDHQSTDGSSLNTCMDLFSNTGANATSLQSTRPNLHDFEQLNSIYSHLDSTNTPLATPTTLAAEPDDDDRKEDWGRLKNQSANGLSSTYERYNRDGSKTITHVYWTIEAAANCPRCDHRRDN